MAQIKRHQKRKKIGQKLRTTDTSVLSTTEQKLYFIGQEPCENQKHIW